VKTMKSIALVLAAASTALALGGALAAPAPAQAAAFYHSDELTVSIGEVAPCAFENAKGQVLEVYDTGKGGDGKYSERGGMPFEGCAEQADDGGGWVAGYNIPWTKKLTIRQSDGKKEGVGGIQLWDYDNEEAFFVSIGLLYTKKVVISTSKDGCVHVKAPSTSYKGRRAYYDISIAGYGEDSCIFGFEGQAKGDLTFDSLAEGASVTGASGECCIYGMNSQQRWYLHGKGRHVVRLKGKKISKVTKASRISDKSTGHRHVCGLTASVVGSSMALLTWKMPKKAKSYRVWRKGGKSGKWEPVAFRKGRSANYYLARGLASEKASSFKVRAYTDKAGKKPLGKASYAVSAVSGKGGKSNAVAVSVTGERLAASGLSGKAGKTAKLSATVSGADGKAPASAKVTWYSSDKKVAKVGRRTGEVTFVKKGKCKVWAKAHNGKNSAKVKVKVVVK